jgi:outer membrane lipoprotein SlyB
VEEIDMHTSILTTIVLSGGIALAGCSNNTETGALGGGLLGAGIGAATGGSGGAIAGGLIGAGAGALLGNSEDEKQNKDQNLEQENARLRRQVELKQENESLRQQLQDE